MGYLKIQFDICIHTNIVGSNIIGDTAKYNMILVMCISIARYLKP